MKQIKESVLKQYIYTQIKNKLNEEYMRLNSNPMAGKFDDIDEEDPMMDVSTFVGEKISNMFEEMASQFGSEFIGENFDEIKEIIIENIDGWES